MAIKQFNSVEGFSVGSTPNGVIDANANITAAALTANGNVSFTGANVSLGSNSNVKLTGGSSGQYLQTDGTGNLSWQAISVSTASISNGNSNVNIPTANGNIQVSVAGTANVITFTSNNAYRGSYGLTGFVYQANTAPSSPQPGDQWYNTFNGILFEYLDDGTTAQWVDISTIPLPNIATVNASAVLNNVQTSGTYYPAFISSTANGNYQLNSNTAFSANLANGGFTATTFVGALSGAATTAGTVTTAAQPNITSVGTLTSLSVTGNVSGGNLTTDGKVVAVGNVEAAYFIGNGSQLTGIDATAIQNGTANVRTFNNANVTVSASGNANILVITGTGANIDGTANVTGNLSANNITTGSGSGGNISGANVISANTFTASANITAANFIGNLANGNSDINIPAAGGNINFDVAGTANVVVITATGVNVSGTLRSTGNANVGNLGTTTAIITTGNITTINSGLLQNGNSNVTITANANVTITAKGTARITATDAGANVTGTLGVSGNANVGNIGATTAILTTGNITTINSGLLQNGNSNITITANGNITLSATGTPAEITITSTGINVAGTLNANGNANVGNLGTAQVLATANVTAPQLISNVATGTAPFVVTSTTQVANLSVATAGTATSATTAGTVTTAAQPNITSVGTLSSLSVTANVDAGNLTTTGVLSVTGTGVSSIAGNLDMTSNTIINLATPTNSTDAATKQYVDDVAQGLHTHDSCNAATQTTLASISGGTVTYNNGTSGVGATLTTTGSYTTIDGVTLSNGMRILVKNEANAAHNGIYDRTSTTVLTRSTDFDTPAEMAGGDFTFVTAGTLYDNTGWVMTDPVTTVGTTDVNWVQFSGAGTYTAGTGLTLTGSQFSVNASQTQVTSVGTLTGLNSSGTITAPAFTANTGVFTGNGSALTALNASNVSSGTLDQARLANSNVILGSTTLALGTTTTTIAGLSSVTSTTFVGALTGAATTAGSVTTAAQGNITSLGTLTGLGVNGTITGVNITANTGVFTGNGSGLSAIAGANVTGTVSSATTAGTVTTAAQPNITSTGTLVNLAMSGTTAATFTDSTAGFSSVQILQAKNGTQVLGIGAAMGPGSFNALVGSNDIVIVGSNTAAQGNANITITPWSTGSGGIRIVTVSNVTSSINLTATTTVLSGALQTANITTGANTTAGSVTGNWTLTAGSRWQATYADLAEKYAADATYEPGTVLFFGGEQEVTLANAFDSTKVAGVVTTNPAYSMNAMLEAEYVAEIALQGRVPCKVIGSVEKGDLLVSASNGHATANNEARAGTIIGKALENFNGDFGIIEVAVGRF